eukprot:scaffold99_cov382-Prasinococcus_capsulatus_cf.AAC.1
MATPPRPAADQAAARRLRRDGGPDNNRMPPRTRERRGSDPPSSAPNNQWAVSVCTAAATAKPQARVHVLRPLAGPAARRAVAAAV